MNLCMPNIDLIKYEDTWEFFWVIKRLHGSLGLYQGIPVLTCWW